LAAHVSWNDTIGPFFRLAALEPGAIVKLELADGIGREYQVIERAQYDKQQLPADRIWTRAGPETLVLVTCGGDFDRRVHRYTDNILVYAVPV
jgi:sortase (surface protein transpeptidase)